MGEAALNLVKLVVFPLTLWEKEKRPGPCVPPTSSSLMQLSECCKRSVQGVNPLSKQSAAKGLANPHAFPEAGLGFPVTGAGVGGASGTYCWDHPVKGAADAVAGADR